MATRWDERGRHFHILFQFQLMGVNGAFLTGDVFNLFVFFEVMLIASYGLMLHGGGPRRLGAGLQYVAINLVGSTLFLFAVGLIYAVTGTLNMADLAEKVQSVAAGDAALLRTGALLLFLVFALKAALVPLHWWLPATYAAAPAPVAALFAIMTKVGAYSIIRVYTLIFGPEAGAAADVVLPYIVPAALITMALGALGALAARRISDLVCFSIVWSMGSLLVAVGLFDALSLAAALYYALHSTLAGAALFLLADLIAESRGSRRDLLADAPVMLRPAILGTMFFLAAIAMAGLPPLSGFTGKLLILEATRPAASVTWIWGLILATSLVVIFAYARAGSMLFWKSEAVAGAETAPSAIAERKPASPYALVAVAALLGGSVALSLWAGPIVRKLEATSAQILDTRAYVSAVLRPPVKAAAVDVPAPGKGEPQ
jgi:multicomponent K+:H+ antiporter subunit D